MLTASSIFPRRSRQALSLLGADGRVRAQPVPARGAVSPRAARRVPGHKPRTVDAGGAAHPIVGRGQRRRRERSADSVDFSRRRSQAVHLRVSRRGRGRHGRGRRLRRRAARRSRFAPRDFEELPRGAAAPGVRQRSVRRDRKGRAAPRCVPFRRAGQVSRRAARAAWRRARDRRGAERRGSRRCSRRGDSPPARLADARARP